MYSMLTGPIYKSNHSNHSQLMLKPYIPAESKKLLVAYVETGSNS